MSFSMKDRSLFGSSTSRGFLQNIVFSGLIANLIELKAWIEQYIYNMTPETLRSVVERDAYRFHLVVEIGQQHIERVLHKH